MWLVYPSTHLRVHNILVQHDTRQDTISSISPPGSFFTRAYCLTSTVRTPASSVEMVRMASCARQHIRSAQWMTKLVPIKLLMSHEHWQIVAGVDWDGDLGDNFERGLGLCLLYAEMMPIGWMLRPSCVRNWATISVTIQDLRELLSSLSSLTVRENVGRRRTQQEYCVAPPPQPLSYCFQLYLFFQGQRASGIDLAKNRTSIIYGTEKQRNALGRPQKRFDNRYSQTASNRAGDHRLC